MANSSSAVLNNETGIFSKSKAFTLAAHISRVLLGLIFLVFGLNGFLHFIPMPPPTGTAAEFFYGLFKAGYLLPLIAFFQVVCGILLLSGRLIPFALLLLFPITLNIFLFHFVLDPAGLGMAIFIMTMNILLAIYYWPVFKPIFRMESAWKSQSQLSSFS